MKKIWISALVLVGLIGVGAAGWQAWGQLNQIFTKAPSNANLAAVLGAEATTTCDPARTSAAEWEACKRTAQKIVQTVQERKGDDPRVAELSSQINAVVNQISTIEASQTH